MLLGPPCHSNGQLNSVNRNASVFLCCIETVPCHSRVLQRWEIHFTRVSNGQICSIYIQHMLLSILHSSKTEFSLSSFFPSRSLLFRSPTKMYH